MTVADESKISVLSISGVNCVAYASGEQLRISIEAQIKNTGIAHVSFKGVELVASPFLNASIGVLVRHMGIGKFKQVVILEDIPSRLDSVIAQVMKVASAPPPSSDAVKSILEIIKKQDGEN